MSYIDLTIDFRKRKIKHFSPRHKIVIVLPSPYLNISILSPIVLQRRISTLTPKLESNLESFAEKVGSTLMFIYIYVCKQYYSKSTFPNRIPSARSSSVNHASSIPTLPLVYYQKLLTGAFTNNIKGELQITENQPNASQCDKKQ